ncbi:MAG TPA: hypothetical protein VI542_00470 [Candidatus Tectomicrobia bacterium]
MQSPRDRWGYSGLMAAVLVRAWSVGVWQCSLFAGVWMLMLLLFLPVHLMLGAALLVVLRREHSAQEHP